jgi:hypothetical protein
MATLHLELDIDSDVHPELFVRLASIERSPARLEKLRQLAATGLIWEIARLHGPAFSEPEAVTFAPPTGPADRSEPAVDAGSVAEHAPIVPEDVPLLVDVVDDAEIVGGVPGEAAPSQGESPDEIAGDPSGRRLPEPVTFLPPPLPAEAPGGRTRSARIRRMKESGLFQNG